jgi:spore maturation protein CgeB
VHRAIENNLLVGPIIERANRALLETARRLRPEVIWIDTGYWVRSATLQKLRNQGCFLVHHITDALYARHWRVRLRRRLFVETLSAYDILFTTNADDQRLHAASQRPLALLTDLGYDDRRFTPNPPPAEAAAKWSNPIVFVGHYEKHTEEGAIALINAGLPVRIYGHPPWFASPNRTKLGDALRPSLNNDDYAYALKCAQIGLCFVSVLNYNQTASRSFEIPGSGTFLLAVRTGQHLQCYEEGREAEFFGSSEELVRKAQYYLDHPDERRAVARRGLERCRSSGYSWGRLMARDWDRVLQIYAKRKA